MSRPDVDVVVVLHHPGAWLRPCLTSVTTSHEVRCGVIVVDNAPLAENRATLAELAPDATVVAMQENAGFAIANNLGIGLGSAPYILCLNQDAAVGPEYLARLAQRLEADPRLGSASGKVLHVAAPGAQPDGQIDSAGILMRRGRRPIDLGQGEPDDGRYDGWREVFGVSAAAALYRRAALCDVAPDGRVFDERFFMYKEDVDLAWRLRLAGYRAGVDGSATAYHGRSSARVPPDPAVPELLRSLHALWRQERAKPAWLRTLSWRNQWLMVLNNERGADLLRSLPAYLASEAALAVLGLALDPIGTLRARAALIAELPAAVAHRRRRRAPRVAVSSWLP